MTKQINREQWLQHAAQIIRKDAKSKGIEIPQVKVSCSWPGGGSAKKRIGECWQRKASKAGVNEIFISPKIADSGKVISILTHELAHAVDDCQSGHKAPFVAIATKMGLEGKPTQMGLTEALKATMTAAMTAKHGEFPHEVLDKTCAPTKAQTARMLKVECEECGAVWRMSAKHAVNATSCPCCQCTDIAVEKKD